jgi:chaperonin GroES
MNLKPINDFLIVELIEKKKVTESGIILTAADPTEANRGLVHAVGPKVTEVVVGEQILPNWNAGRKIKVEGIDYYMLREDDVVLVFDNPDEE